MQIFPISTHVLQLIDLSVFVKRSTCSVIANLSCFNWLICQYVCTNWSVNICTKEVLVLSSQIWAPHGAPMLVHSSPMKSRKWLAHDVFDTFASHACLVHVVIDADCGAQNGSSHGCISATFSCWCLANRMRNWVNDRFGLSLYAIHTDRACDALTLM